MNVYSFRVWMIYPIILFARGFAIALFWPLLRLDALGTGCTWKEAVIMWWGGLRGSVGLALGLIVHHTEYDGVMWGQGFSAMADGVDSLNCRDQPTVVLLMTMQVVMFTVVINGMTMAPLMRALKLTEVPQERRFMLNAASFMLDHVANRATRAQRPAPRAHRAQCTSHAAAARWSLRHR